MSEAASRLRRLIEIGLAEPESATAINDRATEPRGGLHLLGPRGEVLGEVDQVVDAGDRRAVVIQTGPWVNELGFLGFGAPKKEVPAEQILFGNKQPCGWKLRLDGGAAGRRQIRSHWEDGRMRIVRAISTLLVLTGTAAVLWSKPTGGPN